MTTATYLTPTIGHGHMENQMNEPVMWQEFINHLPTKHKMTFQHLKLKDDRHPIVQAIMSGHMVAASDGSFKDAQGTAAWMFYNNWDPKTSLGEGAIATPGARAAAQGFIQKQTSWNIWYHNHSQCISKVLLTDTGCNPHCL